MKYNPKMEIEGTHYMILEIISETFLDIFNNFTDLLEICKIILLSPKVKVSVTISIKVRKSIIQKVL